MLRPFNTECASLHRLVDIRLQSLLIELLPFHEIQGKVKDSRSHSHYVKQPLTIDCASSHSLVDIRIHRRDGSDPQYCRCS